MQNQQKQQEVKGGMVLYPVEYVVNESNPDMSYCYGLNEYSKPVVFYLNPTEQARQNAQANNGQTIPSFEEFADDDRRNPKQCLVSENNGPKNPNGMLLMEQVSSRSEGEAPHLQKYPNTPVYEAKWASILREGDHMFAPPIGFGYMEIGYHPKVDGEVDSLRFQYNEVQKMFELGQLSEVDADEQKERLYLQITSKRKKWFTAVVLKHRYIQQIETPSKESFANALLPYLNHYTDNGMYGGALVRVRRGDVVDSNLSSYCNMQYDYKNRCVKSSKDVYEDWFKYNGGRILKAVQTDIIVEIIPTQRINMGKMSGEKYNKDLSSLNSKLMKTYVDRSAHFNPDVNFFKDKVFLASKVSVRLAKVRKGESKGGVLGSTIHSFSSPMGNAFSINEKGEFPYKMDFGIKNLENNQRVL